MSNGQRVKMRQDRGRGHRRAGGAVAPNPATVERRAAVDLSPWRDQTTLPRLHTTAGYVHSRVLSWGWGSCHGQSRRLLCGLHLRPHHHKLTSPKLLFLLETTCLQGRTPHPLRMWEDAEHRRQAADPQCHPIQRPSSSPQQICRPATRQY